MTVIAWDGKTLAADKRATNNGHASTTTKIQRVGDMLIGMAGDACYARAMLEWARTGFDPATFPEHQKSKDDFVRFVVIEKSGRILEYELTPYPVVVEDRTIAVGSGRDYALAAMHLGKNAQEAVKVACALDIYCGNGIDVLEF